jgi:DNA-binding response OmpR family regulator
MQKILIVEDDVQIRELYSLKLNLEGYDVITANDGAEGLKAAEQHRPELILLDLKMPFVSGDKMLQDLRETAWGAPIKVIILTNISKDEAPKMLRFLNVERYIVKAHHTPKQMVDVVAHVLK